MPIKEPSPHAIRVAPAEFVGPPRSDPRVEPRSGSSDEANGREAREVSREEIERSLETLNRAAETANEKLSFVLHDASGRLMVQVINANTGEVVREIPPREVLDAEARIREMIGLFLNQTI